MKVNLANIRRNYQKGALTEARTPQDPFTLFNQWLNEAIEAKAIEPTAVIVGTVSPEGKPATRTVLLKEVRNEEFIFYTNYQSRKGEHLEKNPNVSLSFVWNNMERQIHIEGTAAKVAPEISDAYFKTRPYQSRIGARISPQSRPLTSRIQLIRAFIKEASLWIGKEVERPEHWGGYAVTPTRIEFWQGRPHRLHDRILYTLQDTGSWTKIRLAP